MKFFIYVFGISLFVSCGNRPSAEVLKIKEVIIDSILSLQVPVEAVFNKGTSFDTDIMYLVLPLDDTLKIEYGTLAFDWLETPEGVMGLEDEQRLRNGAPRERILYKYFSDDPVTDEQLGIFSKNFYFYDTINNIVVKCGRPKNHRYGGAYSIYAPKLKNGQAISLGGENIDSMNIEVVERIFASLRYVKSGK
jgi:hypothetical protein